MTDITKKRTRSRSKPAVWNIDLLLDIELPVSVSFGNSEMQLKDILNLRAGSVIELDKSINDPVTVIVNRKPIAKGEVVMIDGNYGVRILEVESTADRVRSLHQQDGSLGREAVAGDAPRPVHAVRAGERRRGAVGVDEPHLPLLAVAVGLQHRAGATQDGDGAIHDRRGRAVSPGHDQDRVRGTGRGRSPGPRRPHWNAREGERSRHHRRAGRPFEGHPRDRAGLLRDEGRPDPALFAEVDPGLQLFLQSAKPAGIATSESRRDAVGIEAAEPLLLERPPAGIARRDGNVVLKLRYMSISTGLPGPAASAFHEAKLSIQFDRTRVVLADVEPGRVGGEPEPAEARRRQRVARRDVDATGGHLAHVGVQVRDVVDARVAAQGGRGIADDEAAVLGVRPGVAAGVEICPTSNLNTRVVSGWDEVRWIFDTFRRNDVRFIISTDGPEMLKTYIRDELATLGRLGILSVEEQEQVAATAMAASFVANVSDLPEPVREPEILPFVGVHVPTALPEDLQN